MYAIRIKPTRAPKMLIRVGNRTLRPMLSMSVVEIWSFMPIRQGIRRGKKWVGAGAPGDYHAITAYWWAERQEEQWSKSAVLCCHRRPKGATMLADLDLRLTAAFVTADDLLPERRRNAMRSVTDAEVVTLAVAQAMMNISSDREFLAAAR
jgi:hypothetical protein